MGEQLDRIENFATGLMELGVLKLKKELAPLVGATFDDPTAVLTSPGSSSFQNKVNSMHEYPVILVFTINSRQ